MDETVRMNDMSLGGRRERASASTKWSVASAMLVAGVGAAMTGARAWAENTEVDDGQPPVWERLCSELRPKDGIELAGFGMLVIALALIASAPYFARSRRRVAVLAGGILVFGVGGYALYDHYHVLLNLRMFGTVPALRADCERYLREEGAMLKPGDLPLGFGRDVLLPESMRRLGVTIVSVTRDRVEMYYWENGTAGIIYDPHHTFPSWDGGRDTVRRTWFSGFYQH